MLDDQELVRNLAALSTLHQFALPRDCVGVPGPAEIRYLTNAH
jgi:hypothetical protein